MILDFANRWKTGTTLGVKFLSGKAALKQRVEETAKLWEEYANIRFDFSDDDNSAIRILLEGGKNDSKIGTDMLTVPKDQPTMVLESIHSGSTDEDMRRIVLHEFGHSLGLIHEHLHPHSTIRLDKAKTREHYMKLGFSEADVELNLFRKYWMNQVHCTEFDQESIMMYGIPSMCTKDGKGYSQPTDFSAADKEFIKIIYPHEMAEPAVLTLDSPIDFKIPDFYQERIFKLQIEPSDEKRYYFKVNSSSDVALSLFRIEDEGEREGCIDYLKPNSDEPETVGTNAGIELNEYSTRLKPATHDYYLRVRLKEPGEAECIVNVTSV